MQPNQYLSLLSEAYPNLPKFVDDMRRKKGNGFNDWNNMCFLPMSIWIKLAANNYSENQKSLTGVDLLGKGLIREVCMLAALGTWRYTKGIFEFDKDIYQTIYDSEVSSNTPSKILMNLPQWCIYVATPNFRIFGEPCEGFWAWIDHDPVINDLLTDREEPVKPQINLRLMFNNPYTGIENLLNMPFEIGDWSIGESINRVLEKSKDAYTQHSINKVCGFNNDDSITEENFPNIIKEGLRPVFSMLLFICSEKPDISDLQEPSGGGLKQPKIKKTKKGWRIFAASGVTHYSVGNRYGKQLRNALKDYEEQNNPDGKRTVKPHVRSAHYHTYWVGKRGTDERRPISKFIMPTIVNGLR